MADPFERHPMAERAYVALDGLCMGATRGLIERLAPSGVGFKIGLQFMNLPRGQAYDLAREITETGNLVMWDVKFSDTPTTVGLALSELLKWIGQHIEVLTIHTTGGAEMMDGAMEAVTAYGAVNGQRPLVFGVTVPTSLDLVDLHLQNIQVDTVREQVVTLARNAKMSGLDGVIASAHEVVSIHEVCGSDFRVITPGIVRRDRPPPSGQKRIATPREAIANGAHQLVLGRLVTGCKRFEELAALRWALDDMQRATQPCRRHQLSDRGD